MPGNRPLCWRRNLRTHVRMLVVLASLACDVSAQERLPSLDDLGIVSEVPAGLFVVHEFQFVGNTVFTGAELAQAASQYVGLPIDVGGLEEARVSVTQYYVDRGYVNSGAIIEHAPDSRGVVILRIVEGRITDVRIQGNKWTHSGFYRRRLGPLTDKPLNVTEVRDRLQVWRQIYPIEQLNAELRPGRIPGEAALDLKITEEFPVHFGVRYANDRPPSTGAEEVTAMLRADTLTGHNDPLSFDYGIVRGASAGLQDAELLGTDDLSASYRFPITARDTTLGAHYIRSSASIIEAQFRELDITAKSEIFGITLSQPISRTPSRVFSLDLIGEHKANQSFLLGIPYSFSPGAVDGETVVSAARLAVQFVDRSDQHLFAGRLTLSSGVNVLDVTENSDGPDWSFFSVLGQAQYVRRLGRTRHEVAGRVVGQYTPDPLLSLEQLSIGGASTVRGYRQSALMRDAGVIASLEFRLSLWQRKDGPSYVQIVPFTDLGAGWNNDRATPSPDFISSAGIGVVMVPLRNVEASLFWGHAFQTIANPSHDLQDHGVNFSIKVWAL
jgi:hemolysin activation/secretion protein